MSKTGLLQQSREKVVRSALNTSTSKQLWSFPKKKRWNRIITQCPHSSYQPQKSTLNSHYPKFDSVKRIVFNERQQSPSPVHYSSQNNVKNKGLTFGQSRIVNISAMKKVNFQQYIPNQHLKVIEEMQNPAPTDYNKFIGDDQNRSKRGFSMRPKTAHSYNYKEKLQVPAPNNYHSNIDTKKRIAKYRSTSVGGIITKSQRFLQTGSSPGPSTYDPKKISLRSNSNYSIPRTNRQTWVGKLIRKDDNPGPGNYQLPSQFGHLLKPTKKRITTIG